MTTKTLVIAGCNRAVVGEPRRGPRTHSPSSAAHRDSCGDATLMGVRRARTPSKVTEHLSPGPSAIRNHEQTRFG